MLILVNARKCHMIYVKEMQHLMSFVQLRFNKENNCNYAILIEIDLAGFLDNQPSLILDLYSKIYLINGG